MSEKSNHDNVQFEHSCSLEKANPIRKYFIAITFCTQNIANYACDNDDAYGNIVCTLALQLCVCGGREI